MAQKKKVSAKSQAGAKPKVRGAASAKPVKKTSVPKAAQAVKKPVKHAVAARTTIKDMASGSGTPALNTAVEAALKTGNPAAMAQIAAVAKNLADTKLNGSVKETIAATVKDLGAKNDSTALQHLAANIERMKDPAVATRMVEMARTANASC